MKPENIILSGVTGSIAYGLDTDTSDEDIKGVYVAPTADILGLFNVRETHDHTNPDWCYHEVGKFISLALKSNPTILELLFLEGYRTLNKQGRMLVDNRHLFLSNIIRKSYGGYAKDQAHKLNARGNSFGNGRNNRYEKHARHTFRLLKQGKQLLETGMLTVRVTPAEREELFAIGKLAPSQLIDRFEQEFKAFDATPSVLPDQPDKEAVNKILLKIRKASW